MNVIRLKGGCLGGGEGRLEIRNDDRFAIYLHDGVRQNLRIDYCLENVNR